MTYKQIETSREARLWLTQVIVPIFGAIMLAPEARKAVVDKLKTAKQNVKNAFKK